MKNARLEETIEILDDPGRRLGWRGVPAGPAMEEQVREWAFGIFARWETDRQVSHLSAVGADEAADILGLAMQSDKEHLLSLLPSGFRADIKARLPVQDGETAVGV